MCPTVKQIYLLVRTKRGKEPGQRLHDIFTNSVNIWNTRGLVAESIYSVLDLFFQLFDGLKKSHGLPFLLSKCTIMSGDCSALELGMGETDRQTVINEVSIVYHCAATIRFDETLKKAVLLNTRGTMCMMDLAEQMKNLDVSAAVCDSSELPLSIA